MRVNRSWIAAAVIAVAVGLAGCASQGVAEEPSESAVKVQAVAGTDRSQVTLTAEAIARLGLKTERVRTAPAGNMGIVPYSAVMYDASGAAWVYSSPTPRSFVRESIVVDRVNGDLAYLKSGPKPGTTVATVGVPELYGAEYGVGGE